MVANQVAKGHDYRNRVVAGWTGPAQVQKGITEPAGYTELDLAYVDACATWPAGLLRRTSESCGEPSGFSARGEGLRF